MENEEWITGKIAVNISGIPLEMEMTVPAVPVKPHRMLPIFQRMTSAIVDIGVDAVESGGERISCKAGCGACCRQPVPISETEVYQIAELVDSMPEPRRTEIRRRFREANAYFEQIGWFDKLNDHFERFRGTDGLQAVGEATEIVLEYFHAGIPCPFLEDESCSIHPDRPIACREYLVTSPAENCAKPTAATVNVVKLLIKPSRAMRKLGTTGRLDRFGFLTLVRALDLAEKVSEDFGSKPGPEWVKDFFSELSNTPAAVRPGQEADDPK